MIRETKIFFRDFLKNILNKYLQRKSFFTKKNTLLIVRIDAIGDYILFRNFIKVIKESERFNNYSITLLGNKIWKDLAEELDHKYIDKFIWIDVNNFFKKSEWAQTFSVLFKLHYSGFETILIPKDTRNWRSELIVNHTGAKNVLMEKNKSFFSENVSGQAKENSCIGSVNNDRTPLFQFYRNKFFTEELIRSSIPIQKPYIEKVRKEKLNGNIKGEYIIVFPGASDIKKMWSAENFGILCKKITEEKNINILVCGSESDKEAAIKIKKISGIQSIKDKTRDGSLLELVVLISSAKLLITNDTCALHIGAALNTKTICITNGLHFGRFHPYPEDMFDYVKTLYPDENLIKNGNFESLARKFHLCSELNINLISPDKVYHSVREFLQTDIQEEHMINRANE